MALRKASAYSKKRVQPYTRTSRNKTRAYIKTVPFSKIVKLTAGDQGAFEAGKFPFEISYVTEESVQIRDNALEACRMYLTKMLDMHALGQYFMAVKVFPHHLVRENKSAGGMAGAGVGGAAGGAEPRAGGRARSGAGRQAARRARRVADR